MPKSDWITYSQWNFKMSALGWHLFPKPSQGGFTWSCHPHTGVHRNIWEAGFPFQLLWSLKWLCSTSEWCRWNTFDISPLLLWQTFKISQLWEFCFGFLSSLKINQKNSLSNFKSRLQVFLTYISSVLSSFMTHQSWPPDLESLLPVV